MMWSLALKRRVPEQEGKLRISQIGVFLIRGGDVWGERSGRFIVRGEGGGGEDLLLQQAALQDKPIVYR